MNEINSVGSQNFIISMIEIHTLKIQGKELIM